MTRKTIAKKVKSSYCCTDCCRCNRSYKKITHSKKPKHQQTTTRPCRECDNPKTYDDITCDKCKKVHFCSTKCKYNYLSSGNHTSKFCMTEETTTLTTYIRCMLWTVWNIENTCKKYNDDSMTYIDALFTIDVLSQVKEGSDLLLLVPMKHKPEEVTTVKMMHEKPVNWIYEGLEKIDTDRPVAIALTNVYSSADKKRCSLFMCESISKQDELAIKKANYSTNNCNKMDYWLKEFKYLCERITEFNIIVRVNEQRL